MTKARQAFLLFLLFLPTIALAGLVVFNAHSLAKAQTCRLKITGYDPRSLLYGRYISYQFDKQDTPEAQNCLDRLPDQIKAGRYYADETLAPKLEALLREPKNHVTMDVHIRDNAPPVLGDLLINGKNAHALASQRP